MAKKQTVSTKTESPVGVSSIENEQEANTQAIEGSEQEQNVPSDGQEQSSTAEQSDESTTVNILEGSPVLNEINKRKKQAELTPEQMVVERLEYVKNFPKEGVNFVDLAPVFADATCMNAMSTVMCTRLRTASMIASIESRGFILSGALAAVNGVGMLMIRKQGKLPKECYQFEAEKEYGTDVLEVEKDTIDLMSVMPEMNSCVIVDDVLATGKTAESVLRFLTSKNIAVRQLMFAVELDGLGGKAYLQNVIKELNLVDVNITCFVTVIPPEA